METKSLLIGIISFISGALLVSIAATTFDKPSQTSTSLPSSSEILEGKTGEAFDQAFISEMIGHHQGAIDMARLAEKQANHQEIKDLSNDIISAQEKEIIEMKQWQKQWGYDDTPATHSVH